MKANAEQLGYLQHKLAYETDSADLYEALGRGDPITVIDGRSTEAHSAEHIPGAISLPHRAIGAATAAALDKSSVLVCYCDGIGCNASTKTALKLLELGFQVRELIGGLDWWKRDGYPTQGSNGSART
ncbi:MAG: rhodanese-like domain-containing protein [Chloroflexi bacterium]|nr:rhodanese-like domain-containing protein [Chloroflexota bacterium]MYC48347.1 rhodanese-like domain-containing protein [Chloroflexota bacterium]